jgi:ribonuclease PH
MHEGDPAHAYSDAEAQQRMKEIDARLGALHAGDGSSEASVDAASAGTAASASSPPKQTDKEARLVARPGRRRRASLFSVTTRTSRSEAH